MSTTSINGLCPCHSNKLYQACCMPFHKKTAIPNALQLMRSRYSAYALGLIGYLQQTAKKPSATSELLEFCSHTQFEGLTILQTKETKDWATVTFIASLSCQGQDCSFKETSLFEKNKGEWVYVSGEVQTIT